ncbi:unnamed protein product [Taenia asiatica]|uniref:Uncharacterized protein n=1 Tax=Taenia asiatica TaxID=60517 RepID=A0A0R3WH76_TAEAS|nr:unnamed protein product [Taenia asiatica]
MAPSEPDRFSVTDFYQDTPSSSASALLALCLSSIRITHWMHLTSVSLAMNGPALSDAMLNHRKQRVLVDMKQSSASVNRLELPSFRIDDE